MTRREICAKATAVKNEMLKRTFWQRFWANVDKSSGSGGCWPWMAGVNGDGYGQFKRNGKAEMAHRLAFEYFFGPIADGLKVLHRCDNPPCCNYGHHFLGTNADNIKDCIQKNRRRYHHGPTPKRQGVKNGRAKLDEARVAAIRKDFDSGLFTKAKLGRLNGVSAFVISGIVNRKLWKHML